jgi:hypothetical protein
MVIEKGREADSAMRQFSVTADDLHFNKKKKDKRSASNKNEEPLAKTTT